MQLEKFSKQFCALPIEGKVQTYERFLISNNILDSNNKRRLFLNLLCWMAYNIVNENIEGYLFLNDFLKLK